MGHFALCRETAFIGALQLLETDKNCYRFFWCTSHYDYNTKSKCRQLMSNTRQLYKNVSLSQGSPAPPATTKSPGSGMSYQILNSCTKMCLYAFLLEHHLLQQKVQVQVVRIKYWTLVQKCVLRISGWCITCYNKKSRCSQIQAGAELAQAQPQLGLQSKISG